MSYIPPDAKWWLADLIVEFRIDGDPGSLVHFNLTLIRGRLGGAGVLKALARGAEFADTYTNTDGRQVQVFFRGLRDLFVVYEELEDGAELLYEERASASEVEISLRFGRKKRWPCLHRLANRRDALQETT
ncbi:MAG: DUF4288 domain-containing protein [Bryobacterales bacterium]|nr:DUF4288 domain-containing protein [Bryobacterales bacterium]